MKLFAVGNLRVSLLVVQVAGAEVAGGALPPAAVPSAIVNVWPVGKMPGHGASGPETNMPPHGDHCTRITNISHPTLSLCLLPKGNTSAPAVVVCPGGGYHYVVYDKEGTEIAAWLNSIGVEALVLKYRVPHDRDAHSRMFSGH